jgi:hypothetical protein
MTRHALVIVVVIVLFAMVVSLALIQLIDPVDAERRLQLEIAACRVRGGEPRLYRDGRSYYVRECWLKGPE